MRRMETTPPDRLRPLVYGSLLACGASLCWGVLAMYTAHFRDWLAPLLGLAIGATLAATGGGLRGRALQALAVGLTGLAWSGALYLTYFGVFLTEVSEHQGHRAADSVPATILCTGKFFAEFVHELAGLVTPARVGWLVAGLVLAAVPPRRRR